MDIVAESLSAKILKSRQVLVNGNDIMDYIRSKLSTAVEFSGVYDSLEEANAAGANFNGSIVIVGSTEYIWSDKDNSWHQIGDETAIGQLALDIVAVSSEVSAISEDVDYIKTISADYKTYAYTSAQLSSDGYALTTDIPTYSDISTNIHLSDYALTNNVSSKIELQQQFASADEKYDQLSSAISAIPSDIEKKYYQLIYPQSFNTDFSKLSAADMTANMISIVPETLFINSDSDLSDVSFKNASIAAITLSAANEEPIEITNMSIVASTNSDSSITADYIGETNQQTFSITGSTKYTFSTPVPLNANTVYFFFKQNGAILSSIKMRFVLEAGTAADPIGPILDSYHPYFVCELAGKNFDVLRRILAHLED